MKKPAVLPSNILLDAVIKGLDDVKGHDIKIIDLSSIDNAMSAFFVIAHGNSQTQVAALASSVEKVVKESIGEKPMSVQGLRNGEWAILDYFDVVVHVFHKDVRSRYALEELWGDAEIRSYESETPVTLEEQV
ncbi:MAG: ribosome silencing factor [Flavobacteriales bacterium]|jgi:ribosome-associated protein|tara:strand:+ start:133 stop:531 length:399 start_codon:yes stop_codon:yes gene_type:complete